MSRESVELVEQVYALIPLGIQTTPDQVDRLFRDYLDEQFELHLPPDYPEGEPVFRGRTGMTQFISMLQDTWVDWRFEPQQFLDAGERVVVSGRILAEGGSSGVPIELETLHVWTVRTGRATGMQVFRDRSEAFEAARLSD
jgi:ketosteroid isomerase-like protein